MHSKKIHYFCLAALQFLTLSSHAANLNPITVGQVQEIVDEVAERKIQTFQKALTYTVGQLALGGIVIYVDETGQHGIVAALAEDSRGVTAAYVPIKNALLAAFSKFGMGGGFQNTIQALALASSTGITSSTFVAAYAARFTTNSAGVETGNSCLSFGETQDPSNCLAEWYIPNLGELLTMNNVLCGTSYALKRGIQYLSSASPFGNTNMLIAVNTPSEAVACQLGVSSSTTEVATNTARSSTVDVRYARQF